MRLEYIDLAISFLENPKDKIAIQHEFTRDRIFIREYICDKLNDEVLKVSHEKIETKVGCIQFINCESRMSAGLRNPIIFVPRIKANGEDIKQLFKLEECGEYKITIERMW